MDTAAIRIAGNRTEPADHKAAIRGMKHPAQLGFIRQHANRPAAAAAAGKGIEIFRNPPSKFLLQLKRSCV